MSQQLPLILEELNLAVAMVSSIADKQALTQVLVQCEQIKSELEKLKLRHLSALSGALVRLYEEMILDVVTDEVAAGRAVTRTVDSIAMMVNDHPGEDLHDEQAAELWGLFQNFSGFRDYIPQDLNLPEVASDTEKDTDSDGTEPLTITAEDLDLYEDFISESMDHIESIENKVLELENHPDDEDLVNEIFRPFHSMKGAAGFLKLDKVNRLSHVAETLLAKVRSREIDPTAEMVDILLEAIDFEKQLLADLQSRLESPADEGNYHLDPQIDIRAIVAELEAMSVGEVVGYRRNEDPKPIEKVLESAPTTGGEVDDEPEQTTPEIQGKSGPAADKIAAGKDMATDRARKTVVDNSIKVDTAKLDSLLELVGELVIAQTLVGQDAALNNPENQDLARKNANMGKIIRGVQDMVMSMRMLPLKQTFGKMSRLIRDLSRKTAKRVRLDISGEDTEVDKTVIDLLNDPLVHILRNSIDHGLEVPEAREAVGKNPEGLIELHAYQEGGNIIIDIRDDGQGIDQKRVLEKAIKQGIVDPNQPLSEHEINGLIFAAGFSTAEKTTDISGRGVGMDVVRKNIENLNGTVEVHSTMGEGTLVRLKLPLTLAIVDGMVVSVNQQTYIIPTVDILESRQPHHQELMSVNNKREAIRLREKVVPIIRLNEFFRISESLRQLDQSMVIIVENRGRSYGIVVDELVGQQQVVIKTLGERFKGLQGISGAAIMGNGRVGLILDVSGVVNSSLN